MHPNRKQALSLARPDRDSSSRQAVQIAKKKGHLQRPW
jgi:hypothetical protein